MIISVVAPFEWNRDNYLIYLKLENEIPCRERWGIRPGEIKIH